VNIATTRSNNAGPSLTTSVLFLALTLGTGAVGGLAAAPGVWYAGLDKPAWNPPAWVFGPVWITLYLMIGLAGALAWPGRNTRAGRAGFALFGLQLLLNALWSWIFFRWHRPDLALAELLVLWAAILGTIIAFRRIRPLAGALLVPYLAWVAFAGLLNAEIARRNPQGVGPTPAGPTRGVAASDCAPWDGSATSLYLSEGAGADSLPVSPPFLHIALYDTPERLDSRTVTLGRSEEGSGTAVWCQSEAACAQATSGTVEFDRFVPGADLTGSYLIAFPDGRVTAAFRAVWYPRRALCG
jgi:tryptophan-rich sensory protein